MIMVGQRAPMVHITQIIGPGMVTKGGVLTGWVVIEVVGRTETTDGEMRMVIAVTGINLQHMDQEVTVISAMQVL